MRPSPEARVLAAIDDLRAAMAAVFAERPPEAPAGGLVTLTAAAVRLGMARSTVTRWADAGRIRTVGPRNARRVPIAEIARLSGPDDAA